MHREASMTDHAIVTRSAGRRFGDLYLGLLALLLLGYATLGKTVAYIGVPPLFIGDIVFVIGVIVLLLTGCVVATLATLPSVLLALTMTWVAIRAMPYLGEYGLDALRDSVIVMYGGMAFIVIGLLVDDSRRIDRIVDFYPNVHWDISRHVTYPRHSRNSGQGLSAHCTDSRDTSRALAPWRTGSALSRRSSIHSSWLSTGQPIFACRTCSQASP